MNLQQLRYLVATAEHGTMTGAATACSVGQPALTRAVRALERELGTPLFRRDGRGVALTDDGREVVAVARRALAEIDAIEAYGRRASRSAVLTIAATATIQSDLGSGLISDFWHRYPQFPVRFLRCESADDVGDAVSSGRADVGVSDLPSSSGLVAVVYETREVVVIAPPGSNLPDPLPVERLADLTLVSTPAGSVRRSALDALFSDMDRQPQIAFESDERSTWIPAVLAGLGCCLWYRTQGRAAGELGAQVVGTDPPLRMEIAVLHRNEVHSPQVAGLVQLARERAKLV